MMNKSIWWRANWDIKTMNIDIRCGDCMTAMAAMDDNQFDIAVVDPPFGEKCDVTQGKSGNRHHGAGWSKQRDWSGIDDWNVAPPAEYFEQLRRVSKHQIIFGGNYFTEYLPPKSCWIIWNKCQRNFTLADGEMAWTSYDTAMRICDYSRAHSNRKRVTKHPTEKPVELYRWIFKTFKLAGASVIDTHLGSGNSAIAALEMGVASFTGFEINENHFAAAKKNIDTATMQTTLFKPEQTRLIG